MRSWLLEALDTLTPRERLIIRERRLKDKARTLDALGMELSISKERVRQLEVAAFRKMRKVLEHRSRDVLELLD